MKKVIGYFIIGLTILIMSCSNNGQKSEHKATKGTNKTLKNNKTETRTEREQLANRDIQEKINKGDAIVLSKYGEALPLKAEGSKVMAVKMPDGNLWQVKKDGNKVMIHLPNGEDMQEKMVNGKMMLISDDNKQYKVEMINGKMIAVKSSKDLVAMSKNK